MEKKYKKATSVQRSKMIGYSYITALLSAPGFFGMLLFIFGVGLAAGIYALVISFELAFCLGVFIYTEVPKKVFGVDMWKR